MVCGAICAALSSELCANNNKFIPSAVAGATVMRASWPAPMMPTVGKRSFTTLS